MCVCAPVLAAAASFFSLHRWKCVSLPQAVFYYFLDKRLGISLCHLPRFLLSGILPPVFSFLLLPLAPRLIDWMIPVCVLLLIVWLTPLCSSICLLSSRGQERAMSLSRHGRISTKDVPGIRMFFYSATPSLAVPVIRTHMLNLISGVMKRFSLCFRLKHDRRWERVRSRPHLEK